MVSGTIVAMGGGGFSMEESPLLDDHVLSLSRRPDRPRVCFVPTASGDAASYADRFLAAFPAERAEASVLTLFTRTVSDLRAFVLAQDVVYVGGGSTANLLAVWRLHGLDEVLREALAEGVVGAGISAGMNCWFEGSVTDTFGPGLRPLADGLGFLAGSACPHYDGEPERRPTFQAAVASSALPAGVAADDGCALVFRDGALVEAVSSRPEARAYRVERVDGDADEQPLEVRHLGG